MNRRDEVVDKVESVLVRYFNDHNYRKPDAIEELDRIYGVLPDDGEPVTNDWMTTICNERKDWSTGTIDWEIKGDDLDLTVRVWAGRVRDVTLILSNSNEVENVQVELKSRGQFRRLCEALGVELKEVKGE